MANYDINYDDTRFQKVESEKNAALSDLEKTYADMANQSDKFYQDQINASKNWADKQAQIQQQQTDFAIDKIEQEKAQAKKDYTKEQSGAYVDWQKQSNQYGVDAEQKAAGGMTNTGYTESSQVAMYNQYQNRVATARESFNLAIQNYNNGITEARLANNAALAEIRAKALEQQLQLALEGFQYKNALVQEKTTKKMQLDSEYHDRYQDVLKQINTENALAEEVRQYNEKMAEEKRQYNETLALQKAQLAEEQRQFNETMAYNKSKSSGGSSGGGGGSSGGGGGGGSSSKKSSGSSTIKKSSGTIKNDDSLPKNTKQSLINAGMAGRSPEYVDEQVKKGNLVVSKSPKDGNPIFSAVTSKGKFNDNSAYWSSRRF